MLTNERFCHCFTGERRYGQLFFYHHTYMKSFFLTALASLLLCLPSGATAKEPNHHAATSNVSSAEALARLKEGNQRFVAGKLRHPHQTAERRTELSNGQKPFAIVLACADSRTAPEVVFDQGLGDVFVVRVAGNVLNDEIVGSIEYAVDHFGTPLIVVLGHERCGAIQAARETIAAKEKAPGHIQSLVNAIRPAVKATAGEDAEATGKVNILNVVKSLRESSPLLKKKIAAGTVSVVGARYKLGSGRVEILESGVSR